MTIEQGDLYWVTLEGQGVDGVGIPHPCVVMQRGTYTLDAMSPITVCALTSNLRRVALPGNLLLDAGEGNLPRQSVVEVAKIYTLHIGQLGGYIGRLSPQRVAQIAAGQRFVERSYFSA